MAGSKQKPLVEWSVRRWVLALPYLPDIGTHPWLLVGTEMR
jgi:hypothetical protein